MVTPEQAARQAALAEASDPALRRREQAARRAVLLEATAPRRRQRDVDTAATWPVCEGTDKPVLNPMQTGSSHAKVFVAGWCPVCGRLVGARRYHPRNGRALLTAPVARRHSPDPVKP